MLYLRNTGRNSRDLAFAIDFLYTNGNVQPNRELDKNNSGEQPEVADINNGNLDVVTRK